MRQTDDDGPAAGRNPTDLTRPTAGSRVGDRPRRVRPSDRLTRRIWRPAPPGRPPQQPSIIPPDHHQCVLRHSGRISGNAQVRESHARTVSGCPGRSQIGQGSKQDLGSFAEQAWMLGTIYPSLNPSPSFLSRVYFLRRPAFVKGAHRFFGESRPGLRKKPIPGRRHGAEVARTSPSARSFGQSGRVGAPPRNRPGSPRSVAPTLRIDLAGSAPGRGRIAQGCGSGLP